MLERIAEIQGIGLLHKANGKPHTCQKATLIYADNGRGKSTLATILCSVSNGDTSAITARKTLDGTLPPKILLQFGSGHKVSFENGAWTEQRPEFVVFDADFVERNVHSGGNVTTNHRKNLLEFALGEAAVAARQELENATSATKLAADNVQDITSQLTGFHAGMTLTQFEKLLQVADIDAKIDEIQKRIVAAKDVVTILSKPIPSTVSIPAFNFDGFFSGLRTSLENVHADAEQVVRSHIDSLGNKNSESWLSQGRQFDDGSRCPYCGQATSGLELIKAYQTHFNTAYSDLKQKVISLCSAAKTATMPNIIDVFSQGISTASAQAIGWAEHVQTEPINFNAAEANTALNELSALVQNLCNSKQASPAEPVGSVEDEKLAISLWSKVVDPMQATNADIKAANDAISVYKGQLASENLQNLQLQIQQLQATKRRYEPTVIELIDKLSTARTEANTTEQTKKAARDKLDEIMKSTLDKYEKSINTLLKDFGASFNIKGMGANFRGAAPRSEYGLLLRGKDIALDGGPPSFSSTLSEGDKRTLAFAFFVASTLADTKLNSRIVVIDDPMCSLDLNRKHHTRSVLKRIFLKAQQLIVLAHDLYFLRDFRDALHKDDKSVSISSFQLTLTDDEYSDFAIIDIDKECESAYFQHHRLLNDFVSGNKCDKRAVAKAIRPMLEGYLHRRFPGLIPKSLLFGQVVALIRDAQIPSPLCHAASLVDELNEINEYAGQFHHDTNPGGADTIVITASELKTFCDRALVAVHKGV